MDRSEYTNKILQGDVLDVLRRLPSAVAQCVTTSPPYWGLRDYSVDGQLGLEPTPEEHVAKMVEVFREVRRVLRDDGVCFINLGDAYWGGGNNRGNRSPLSAKQASNAGAIGQCAEHQKNIGTHPVLKPKDLCGMPWRVALALQQPYYTGCIKDVRDRIWLAAMIDAEGCIFIHKRKVGQSNGQGYDRKNDTYGPGLEISNTHAAIIERCMEITGHGSICTQLPDQNYRRKQRIYRWNLRTNQCRNVLREVYPHLVAKQHEARLAIGCPSNGQKASEAHESLKGLHSGYDATIDFNEPASMFEQGWYLRSDIIWKKNNPMPESVTDRPTKSHEYIFLLTKRAKYYYDSFAVREGDQVYHRKAGGYNNHSAQTVDGRKPFRGNGGFADSDITTVGRNKRSVWTVPTQQYKFAHFACFPEKLIEPCILAGTSERGCCVECGKPWERVVEKEYGNDGSSTNHIAGGDRTIGQGWEGVQRRADVSVKTLGWRAGCTCEADTRPCLVLDPFMGAGTSAVVAKTHKRAYLGIELSQPYIEIANTRIRNTQERLF